MDGVTVSWSESAVELSPYASTLTLRIWGLDDASVPRLEELLQADTSEVISLIVRVHPLACHRPTEPDHVRNYRVDISECRHDDAQRGCGVAAARSCCVGPRGCGAR